MCLLIYFGLLGLRCFMGLSLVVVSRGYFLVALQRLLIAVASLDAELGLSGIPASVVVARGLSSCSFRALERRPSSWGAQIVAPASPGMWDIRDPGIKPHLCIGGRVLYH